nr:hypothetical protein [Paenibacillus bovis]
MQKMNHETNNHSSTGTSAKSTSSSKKVVAILGAIILIGVIIYISFTMGAKSATPSNDSSIKENEVTKTTTTEMEKEENEVPNVAKEGELRPIQEIILNYDMEALSEVRKKGISPLNLILVGNDINVEGAKLQNAIKPVIAKLGLKLPNINEATAIWFLSNNPEKRDLRVGLLAYEWYLHHNAIINDYDDIANHKEALSELPALKKAIMENISPAYIFDSKNRELLNEYVFLIWSRALQDVYNSMTITNIY